MKVKRSRIVILIWLVLLLFINISCRRSGQPLTEEQVTAMAESALIGLNDDDYEAWTEHFGSMMKAAVPQDVFATVREGVLSGVGPFQSIASVESGPAQTEGHVRWVITGNFEKGQLRLIYVIPADGDRIEGVFIEEAG